jgi:hypothetical protein
MTRHEYRGSLHGPSRALSGGGVRGGSRAFIVKQAKAMSAAFIPAMMSRASRKSITRQLCSVVDTSHAPGKLTEQLDQIFNHDRVDDTGQTASADDNPDRGTSLVQEPMSRHGRRGGIQDRA